MSELDLFDFYKIPFFKFKIDNETQGVLRLLSSSHPNPFTEAKSPSHEDSRWNPL